MLHRFHDRFGTAGVVIGVIALIVALGGTAFAAAGLNTKQKKEVTKIAKKYAGKPGAPGPAGTPGTNGTNGTNGKDGAPGANGKSVAVTAVSCGGLGGAEVKQEGAASGVKVCNGEEGEPGVIHPGETLPSGATETGSWGQITTVLKEGVGQGFWAISFPIPLAADLDETHVIGINKGGTPPAECENEEHPGTASSANPEAKSGYLCIYIAESTEPPKYSLFAAKAGTTPELGASTAGALVYDLTANPGQTAYGTFAVTG